MWELRVVPRFVPRLIPKDTRNLKRGDKVDLLVSNQGLNNVDIWSHVRLGILLTAFRFEPVQSLRGRKATVPD